MFMFNDAIIALRLVELPLLGRRFTWTNKQSDPLLERLDWFFTSNSWTLSFPNILVWPRSCPLCGENQYKDPQRQNI